MQARSSGQVYRRLFREIIKEQLPWISGRTITPKCRFSGGSLGKNDPVPGVLENTIIKSSTGSNMLWAKIGLTTRGADLGTGRMVQGLGGLRGMGVTHRPAGRASQHGTRTVLPTSDEERHTNEFLKEEKRKQAEKVRKTERQVGSVAGQSLAATDTEFLKQPGRNTADTQKDIAGEKTRKSELGAEKVDSHSASGHHIDPNGEHPSVDEEVRRGLMADSAFPLGRTEKVHHEDEKTGETAAEEHHEHIRVDVSEHGSFKTL